MTARTSSTYPELNLAITLAEEAGSLRRMSAVLQQTRFGDCQCSASNRLYPLASLNLWADVSADVERVYKPLLDGAFTDFDVARFTQKTAQCCLDNGRKTEAIKLFELALTNGNLWSVKKRLKRFRLLGRTSTGDGNFLRTDHSV